jgi:hypothetical protein
MAWALILGLAFSSSMRSFWQEANDRRNKAERMVKKYEVNFDDFMLEGFYDF